MTDDHDYEKEFNSRQINIDKAKVFHKNKIPVHLVKLNGKFLNGLLSKVGTDFLIIQDLEGERVVLFNEIKGDIVEFQEPKQ